MTVRQLSDYDADGQCLGQDVNDKISFYGLTPVPQRASSAQAALTDNSGGTADDTVEAVALSGGTPSGALDAQVAAVNNNFADLAAKVNEIRETLVSLGLMKGGA